MRTEIVMLSGRQGSGKSTITNELKMRYLRNDWLVFELRFAGTIYSIHDHIRNTLRASGIDAPEKDGELLQYLGTDFGRKKYGDDVWVQVVKNQVKRFTTGPQNKNLLLIISDCRFENEFDAFPEALRVRLLCPEEIRKKRAESWRENTLHPSETGLDQYEFDDKFDLYLLTNGTIPIKGCVELIMAQLDKGTWKEKRNDA